MQVVGLPGRITQGARPASRLCAAERSEGAHRLRRPRTLEAGPRGWPERPPRSPKLNGHVERNNGAWRYEFYATWDFPDHDLGQIDRWIDAFADEFNNFRPHRALDNRTPAQYLQSPAADGNPTKHPASHMS